MFGIVPVLDSVSALPIDSMMGVRIGGEFYFPLGEGLTFEYRGTQFIPILIGFREVPQGSDQVSDNSAQSVGRLSGGVSHRFGIRFAPPVH